MTPTFAVSLFPWMTLVACEAYTCGNGTSWNNGWPVGCPRLPLNNGRREELHHTVTSQRRCVSDNKSWVVRYAQPDSFQQHFPCDEEHLLGVSFDVLDWTTHPTRTGSCLYIANPYELRYVHGWIMYTSNSV